jgi:hypothetical protein
MMSLAVAMPSTSSSARSAPKMRSALSALLAQSGGSSCVSVLMMRRFWSAAVVRNEAFRMLASGTAQEADSSKPLPQIASKPARHRGDRLGALRDCADHAWRERPLYRPSTCAPSLRSHDRGDLWSFFRPGRSRIGLTGRGLAGQCVAVRTAAQAAVRLRRGVGRCWRRHDDNDLRLRHDHDSGLRRRTENPAKDTGTGYRAPAWPLVRAASRGRDRSCKQKDGR